MRMFEYDIYTNSICTEKFLTIVRKLSAISVGKPFAIFLFDNLSVHKTNLSKELFGELQVTPIFNIPSSPKLNCIESYIEFLKIEYKNLLFEKMMMGDTMYTVSLIKKAIKRVKNN